MGFASQPEAGDSGSDWHQAAGAGRRTAARDTVERLITHQPDSLKLLTLLRVGLLLATIPLQLRFMRNRAASRQAAAMLKSARWNWLLVAKAALVAAALGLQVALDAIAATAPT